MKPFFMIVWCCIVSRKIPFMEIPAFLLPFLWKNGRFVIQTVGKAQKGDARCKKAGKTTGRHIEEQKARKEGRQIETEIQQKAEKQQKAEM